MSLDLIQTIKTILTKDARTRDSDRLLCAIIWRHEIELKGVKISDVNAYQFLLLYRDKELSSSESIARIRRKVQEEISELKGLEAEDRDGKQEDVKAVMRQDSLFK